VSEPSADGDRRLALAAALAQLADPIGLPALREAAVDPLAEIRLIAQLGLIRLGDTDVALLDRRLVAEPDLGVFAVLAARAGRLPIDARSITSLGAQAAYTGSPPELRASCTWAVAEHDLVRGGWLAGNLLADEEGAFWLASIVGRRGGVLVPVVAGLAAQLRFDRVADLIELA
jgi:hypothetical protein